jgi:hypothetical protein
VFTILVALGFFIFKHYKSAFTKFSREKYVSISINELNNKIDKNINSLYKDSLKILLKDYSGKIKFENVDSLWGNYSRFVKKLRYLIEDKKVDSLDFIQLKNIVKENERSTKN